MQQTDLPDVGRERRSIRRVGLEQVGLAKKVERRRRREVRLERFELGEELQVELKGIGRRRRQAHGDELFDDVPYANVCPRIAPRVRCAQLERRLGRVVRDSMEPPRLGA
eukprot:Amastigsp_a178390_61.p2 type:complete len:110 gc:universal Amastigsp_a178390_61:129-458(+)